MLLLKFLLKSFYALFLLFLLMINYQLWRFDVGAVADQVQAQRLHLQRVIHQEQAAEQMQSIFPEGFVFTNVLYGLAWCDRAQEDLKQDEFITALREIDFSIAQLESNQGRAVFSPILPLPYGAFYNGWLNYLRGKSIQCRQKQQLHLNSPNIVQKDSVEIQKFKDGCAAIATAWRQFGRTYLESYSGQTWPADNILCLASLALHDRLFEPEYQGVIHDWLLKIKEHRDPITGLIPHAYASHQEWQMEGARGSSQSLMLCFLPEIDTAFAREQFVLYQQHFLAYRFGLPGIREYPQGKTQGGDIDSGPVVMSIGGAASVVGIRAMGLQSSANRCDVLLALTAGIEAWLFPSQYGNERTFIWGKLPVLDAFLAWSEGGSGISQCTNSTNWRWKFQLITLFLALPLVYFFRKRGSK